MEVCEAELENELGLGEGNLSQELSVKKAQLEQIDSILKGVEQVPEGQILCLTTSGNPYLLDLNQAGKVLEFE